MMPYRPINDDPAASGASLDNISPIIDSFAKAGRPKNPSGVVPERSQLSSNLATKRLLVSIAAIWIGAVRCTTEAAIPSSRRPTCWLLKLLASPPEVTKARFHADFSN